MNYDILKKIGLLFCSWFLCGFAPLLAQNDDQIMPPTVQHETVATDTAAADSVFPPFDFGAPDQIQLGGLFSDSTMIIGSRYVSFGDVLDWLPGGYLANRGTSGQLAYGSLFGRPLGEMTVEYGGLILNNPINGQVDLNLVPVQNIGNLGIVHTAARPFAFLPLGASLQVQPMTIADNPIRSQVGYRTGYYEYNDVDVRVGILPSSKWWLDFGGVIKSWLGYVANQNYSGNKFDFALHRRIGSNWMAIYRILFNQRDTHVPLPAAVDSWPQFSNPREKDRRTDHGLQLLYKSFFKSSFQFTKFEEDRHAEERSVFDQRHDAYTWRWTNEMNDSLLNMGWRAGVTGFATFLNSNRWGKKNETEGQIYADLKGHLSADVQWLAAVRAASRVNFKPQIMPEMGLFWTPDTTARFSYWLNRTVTFPSLHHRFADEPFVVGSESLAPATIDQAVLAGEKKWPHLFLHGSIALQRRSNQLAAVFADEQVQYKNLEQFDVLSSSLLADYSFLRDWRIVFKGDVWQPLGEAPTISNQPNFYLKSFLQYHLIKFQGDLNARLRIGAYVIGNRYGATPYYAQVSDFATRLAPVIYPYLHAVLLYRSAEIFLSFENYIDADVQYVYGYPMPGLWFRYGFIWHFID